MNFYINIIIESFTIDGANPSHNSELNLNKNTKFKVKTKLKLFLQLKIEDGIWIATVKALHNQVSQYLLHF